ncbi:hypothetical protein, partial [Roseobacter cerasinus]|uniref:hypothetical protein n=1 Tax=Roseobacter cerasinus TaxID=2602289 RepID=UPI001357CBC2
SDVENNTAPDEGPPLARTKTPEAELLEEFGGELPEGEITEEEAITFLMAYWNIATTFARLGFHVGTRPAKAVDNISGNPPDLCIDVLSLFTEEDTEHETVAPRSPQNDEAQSCKTPKSK